MLSFPQVSPPKPCTRLSPPPYAPHALPISFKEQETPPTLHEYDDDDDVDDDDDDDDLKDSIILLQLSC